MILPEIAFIARRFRQRLAAVSLIAKFKSKTRNRLQKFGRNCWKLTWKCVWYGPTMMSANRKMSYESLDLGLIPVKSSPLALVTRNYSWTVNWEPATWWIHEAAKSTHTKQPQIYMKRSTHSDRQTHLAHNHIRGCSLLAWQICLAENFVNVMHEVCIECHSCGLRHSKIRVYTSISIVICVRSWLFVCLCY